MWIAGDFYPLVGDFGQSRLSLCTVPEVVSGVVGRSSEERGRMDTHGVYAPLGRLSYLMTLPTRRNIGLCRFVR